MEGSRYKMPVKSASEQRTPPNEVITRYLTLRLVRQAPAGLPHDLRVAIGWPTHRAYVKPGPSFCDTDRANARCSLANSNSSRVPHLRDGQEHFLVCDHLHGLHSVESLV